MALKRDWREVALANYKEGASDTEVTVALQIPYREFLNCMDTDTEFRQIVEMGRDLAKAFWYEVGRKNVKNNKFNTTLWYANMKNRYGWSDKVTTDSAKPVKELSDDQLEQELNSRLSKIADKAPNVVKLKAK